MDMLISEH